MNSKYYDGLVRDYGHDRTASGLNLKHQANTRHDEIEAGMEFHNVYSDNVSTVVEKRETAILMHNRADLRSRNSKASGGGLKGISCTNWYTMDEFNRIFKKK